MLLPDRLLGYDPDRLSGLDLFSFDMNYLGPPKQAGIVGPQKEVVQSALHSLVLPAAKRHALAISESEKELIRQRV